MRIKGYPKGELCDEDKKQLAKKKAGVLRRRQLVRERVEREKQRVE